VSWNATSNDALANATPVNPPIVNKNKKAIAYNIGTAKRIDPPYNVANQEKILIPVGTAITIVDDVKYALVSASNPTIYI
jgi:hypothetical protein